MPSPRGAAAAAEGVRFLLVIQPLHLLVPPSLTQASADAAPVTCLVVSNDQRRLLSGDARGRVFAWCLPDASGKTNEHWLKDSLAAACMGPVRCSEREREKKERKRKICHNYGNGAAAPRRKSAPCSSGGILYKGTKRAREVEW